MYRPAKITPQQVAASLDFYKMCAQRVGDKAEFARLEAMGKAESPVEDCEVRDPVEREMMQYHHDRLADVAVPAEAPEADVASPNFDIRKFMFGGNATFTVVSKGSGKRFTFKVRQPKADTPHFVSVLTGSDNESDYAFLGTIFNRDSYRRSAKSSIGPSAPSAQAFEWFFKHLNDPALETKVDVHHEGRCCRCGRKLTVPESIESGIGPECAKYF